MIDFACKRFELDSVIKCALGLSKTDMKLMHFMIENDDDWFTANELSNKHKLDLTTAQRAVKKLHEKGVIDRSQENLSGGGYVFRYRVKYKKELRKLIFSIVESWTERVKGELDRW